MLDHILVYLNGQRHEVRGGDAVLSLSDYLRRECSLVGTKVVCSEGDCGACTVLLGRVGADSPRLNYRPVDSCIQFMFQLEGAHVVTIEALGSGSAPSAVQQAMIECHGSQCGYCTPGFVMAMTGLQEERDAPDEAAWRSGLVGNLCRCTGYLPILAAAAQCPHSQRGQIAELFPAEPMLAEFQQRRRQTIEIADERDGRRHVVMSPPDLSSALTMRHAHPDATIIAGATDVGVRINKSNLVPQKIIDLNRVAELESIDVDRDAMRVGARATWSSLERVCETLVPEFHRMIARFGGPQIRHVGTFGGNLANASPAADSLPFLFVMDAVIELTSVAGSRRVPITEFYSGYKEFDLRPGELITRVEVPLPADHELLRLYKISRRRDLDIASFTAAIRMHLEGETIQQAAIALGAVAPTVIRARRTEAFLVGRPFDEDTMRAAGAVAVGEISPLSDVRGSADYRRQLTRNVLLKFYYESPFVAVPA